MEKHQGSSSLWLQQLHEERFLSVDGSEVAGQIRTRGGGGSELKFSETCSSRAMQRLGFDFHRWDGVKSMEEDSWSHGIRKLLPAGLSQVSGMKCWKQPQENICVPTVAIPPAMTGKSVVETSGDNLGGQPGIPDKCNPF